MNAFLEFDNIGKSFPGVQALDGVTFGVAEGSVHALIGENGAGKSTLLKILSGAYAPSAGTLRIAGRGRVFTSTAEAISAGVAVIYQELHLVPDLSVEENLFLGHLPHRLGVVDRRKLRDDAMRQLRLMGESIHPATRIRRLPIAQRQMVEIAKALSRGAKIIAFDEPTSSLSAREVERLFAIMRDLRRMNHAILYVSHRLDEIFAICDAATVFRDGRRVETFDNLAGVTRDTLVNRMVGRDIDNIFHYQPRPRGEPALQVEGALGPGLSAPATLSVARGEIVGLFGLVGAGRSELLRLIFGARRMRGGATRVHGRPARIRSPRDAIRAGVMFCPEDRKQDGIIPIRSVLENVNLSARRIHARLGLFIDESWERANAEEKVRQLAIRTPSLRQLIMNLSGGNQQKTILARWLSERIKVILLDEPTRGIDVGAKSEIYSIIYDLARQGVGVVMATSELPEALGVCDRILVMRQGRIVGELARAEADQEKALKLALPVGIEREPTSEEL